MRYHFGMRIVVDTSVFVAAVLGPAGPSREIIRRCLTGEFQPIIGTALFTEYESLLAREGKFDDCLLTAPEREELLDAFLSVSEWIQVYYLWRPNLQDEADNHIMELAISGAAGYVVTNNLRDFRGGELTFPAIRIVSPQELLRQRVK